MRNDSMVIVISGPSGVGKTTLCERLVNTHEKMGYSVSETTRHRRKNEKDKSAYFFISEEDFKDRIEQGAYLEWANVHGDYYGTPQEFVDKRLDSGLDVLLELDVQGGIQIKGIYRDRAVLIFISPPTPQTLEERLKGRDTDAPEVIRKRLLNAYKEMNFRRVYDYEIINDNVDDCFRRLNVIIEAEKYKVKL